MKKKLILYLLICFLPNNHAENIFFKQLNSSHGLSNNYVHSLYQDKDGFLWIGTSFGLNRFDGTTVKTFQNDPFSPNPFPLNNVYDVVEDKYHNLWCSSAGDICCLRRETARFERYSIQEIAKLSNMHIYALGVFGDLLYLGSNLGIYVFDPQSQKVNKLFLESNKIGEVRSILPKEDGTIWFSGSEKVYKYSSITGKLSKYNVVQSSAYRQDESVARIVQDQFKQIWIGANSGVYKYVEGKDELELVYAVDGNLDLQVDYPLIWIASWTKGLIKYNIETQRSQYFHYKGISSDEPCSNTLTRILIDSSKNIWIGSGGRGISYIDDQTRVFTTYIHEVGKPNSLYSTQIREVYQDSKNQIWIGTHFGLNRYNVKENTFTSYYAEDKTGKESPLNNFIISLCEDNDGTLWVGTLAGLNVFNPTTKSYSIFSHLSKDELLTSNQIWSIYKDSKGWLWVGSRQGVFYLNPKTKEYITYFFDTNNSPATPNKNSATCFLEENDRVWIGTKDGIVRINKDKSLTYLYEQQGLSSKFINQIYRDRQDNIWICSSNGLQRYVSDEKGFENHLAIDYFKNIQFFNIKQDKDNNLWLVTSKHLVQYNPNNKKYYIVSPLDKALNSEFSSTGFIIDHANHAYIGSTNGLNSFSISDFRTKTSSTNIHFTKFSLFNIEQHPLQEGSCLQQPIDITNEIVLSYKQNFFSIDYVSVNLTQGNQMQYSYMLEGFDKDWIDARDRTAAYYTQVPPGRYIFKVKLLTSQNQDGGPVRSIVIQVKAPFYATWYAYVFYGLIVVLLMYFFRKYSLIDINDKNKLLLYQLEKEKDDEIADMKVKFFMNISHEFRTPLTLISAPLEKLLESERSQDKQRLLLLIQKNAHKLLHLIDQLLEFRKTETGTRKILISPNDIINNTTEIVGVFEELAERQAIYLELKTNLDALQVWFDPDMYEKILFNLLSNSFKNTPSGGRISVYITTVEKKKVSSQKHQWMPFWTREKWQVEPYVKISVEDTGCGIPADKQQNIFDRFFQIKEERSSTGIGLSLVKNLVELHQGYIEVDSLEKIGTRFDVYLPLGRGHFKSEDIISESKPESYVILSKPVDLLHLCADIYHQIEEENRLQFSEPKQKDKQSILIVEDNPDIVLLVKESLSDSYQLYAAENGKAGLIKAMKILPNLIICDINMPLMTGIELTESLKTNEKTAHIPIILLTALCEAEYELKGFEYGADDFISKPFNVNALKLKIKNLLSTIGEQQRKTNSQIIMKEFGPQSIESEDDFIGRFNGYLRENLSNPNVDVDTIVDRMNTSRSQLYRKIKALTGMPVKIYVRTYRLVYAKKLLENSNIRISEVMDSVGINSRSYFIKSFKDLYSVTPSDYQKTYINTKQ